VGGAITGRVSQRDAGTHHLKENGVLSAFETLKRASWVVDKAIVKNDVARDWEAGSLVEVKAPGTAQTDPVAVVI
jgi:hypothetical protein